jgi:hypothetical protein
MRDELDIAYDLDRPSRLSRVVVLLSTLAVAVIAIWVFAPILLSNYTSFTLARTTTVVPRSAAPVEAPRAIAAVAAVVPAAAAAPAAPAAPSTDTTAAATANEPAASSAMPSAIPPALRNFNARAGGGWPNDPPSRSLPPAFAATNDPPTTSAIAAPNDPPAARADANPVQLASVSPATASADAVENVPLPRARPSRLIAARLAIPLPRPRPDIPEEAPTAPSTFDLQVERMR